MFDVGWSELLIVGALALIVVGPKDLPRMTRELGRWMGQARGLARQFQRSMDDAAREADLDEFKQLRNMKSEVESSIADPARWSGTAAKPGDPLGKTKPADTVKVSEAAPVAKPDPAAPAPKDAAPAPKDDA